MEMKTNATGQRRKEMVNLISKAIGVAPVYKGAPTFAYAVGNFTVTRDGNIEFDERVSEEQANRILWTLSAEGFDPRKENWKARPIETHDIEAEQPETEKAEETTTETEQGQEEAESEASEGIDLAVSIPADKVNLENLDALLAAKGSLIKKALGQNELEFKVTNEEVTFPWFKNTTPDEALTYTKFIAAICEMTRTQKRISAKEKAVDNEKYAFRCFLLRLGFIGDEFETAREILLKNMDGSAAWRQAC